MFSVVAETEIVGGVGEAAIWLQETSTPLLSALARGIVGYCRLNRRLYWSWPTRSWANSRTFTGGSRPSILCPS